MPCARPSSPAGCGQRWRLPTRLRLQPIEFRNAGPVVLDVEEPGPRHPPASSASRLTVSLSMSRMAPAMAVGSIGSTRRAPSPAVSSVAPPRLVMTAVPRPIASMIGRPNPSVIDGNKTAVACRPGHVHLPARLARTAWHPGTPDRTTLWPSEPHFSLPLGETLVPPRELTGGHPSTLRRCLRCRRSTVS